MLYGAFAPLTRGKSDKGKGPADMTVYPPVSVFLGDCGKCQLELDGGELTRVDGDHWSNVEFNDETG